MENDLIKKFQVYSTDNLYIQFNRRLNNLEEITAIKYILDRRKNGKIAKKAQWALEYERRQRINPVFFGSKQDSYVTEEEMIEGFKCEYKNLSVMEKIMFDNTEIGTHWKIKN